MIKSVVPVFLCLFGLALFSVAHADTPLELSMKRTAKAYKQLTLDLKQPLDASKDDYLALAATMKAEAQKGRNLVPKKAAALPADQQAKMVAAYQKSMDDLSATIDTLTQALQNGQWDYARKAMTQLGKQENEGHKEFRKKDTKPILQTSPPPTDATPTTPPLAAPAPVTPAPTPAPSPSAPNQ